AGDAGPDGPAHAGDHGPPARLRPGQADPPGLGGRARAQPGHALSGPATAPGTGLGQVPLGSVRPQPPREVLRADRARAAADGGGGGELAAHGVAHGAVPAQARPNVGLMWRRLCDLFRRRRREAELDEELRHHLESLEAEHRARGLSAEEARQAAERDLGGLLQTKEACRDQRRIPVSETLWREVRFGARSLRRTPGVSAAIAATLAVAIGGTAAVFTVVSAVLLRPLPYPDAERLVSIVHPRPGGGVAEEFPSAPYLYFTFRDDSRTLEAVGLWRAGSASVTGLERPEQIQSLF